MTRENYEKMTLAELKEVAKNLGIKNISKLKKLELVDEIIKKSPNKIEKDGVVLVEKIAPKAKVVAQEAEVQQEQISEENREEKKERLKVMINESGSAKGVLEVQENNNFGFLRCDNYQTGENDIYVSPSQIRRFNLRTGDEVQGKVREAKEGEKFKALLFVEKVNGEDPNKAIGRKAFESLTPIYPNERLHLESKDRNDLSSRLMDIICPIGKGQRGIIVAPPKAGKTTLLKKVAQNISRNYPDVKLIVLLIDERPEEVTDMKRSIDGDVIYSTFDEEPQNHIKVSRMDDMIFEEFKGTGNMEVHLDRKLQERRIFPAIDIYKSGTRKEDLLLSEAEKEVAFAIRRVMYRDGNIETITENLINMLSKTKDNEEFISVFPKSEAFKK